MKRVSVVRAQHSFDRTTGHKRLESRRQGPPVVIGNVVEVVTVRRVLVKIHWLSTETFFACKLQQEFVDFVACIFDG